MAKNDQPAAQAPDTTLEMASWVVLDELRLWDRNYNRGDVQQIKRSIKRYGFNNALRTWQGIVMAGNHSTMALRELQAEDWTPKGGAVMADAQGRWLVKHVALDHLSRIESEAFAVADNEVARRSKTDRDALGTLLSEIAAVDAAMLDTIGLAESAVKSLIGSADVANDLDAPPDIDRADDLLGKWKTAAGQVWGIEGQGGRTHRLIVGDCRDADTVRRLFDGQMAQIAFTSPPYAMQRAEQYGGTPAGEYVAWWEAVQACTRAHLAEGGSFFVNIKAHAEDGERHLYVHDLVLAMRLTWKWMFVDEFCWKRSNPPGRWKDRFRNGFEPVFQFANGKGGKFRPEAVGHWSDDVMVSSKIAGTVSAVSTGDYYNTSGATRGGLALPDNVIEVSGVESGVAHAAMFPVGLPQFFIKAFTDDGDMVYDPFMGSGTTMVAAEQVGRVAYGCEILPKYAAVLLERVSKAGMTPRLEATNG